MNKLQAIPVGEQATLKATSTDTGVEVTFSVKENGEKGTPRYNLTWQFDFEGVTAQEVGILAARSLRIDGQATWRKAKDKMDADVWQDRKWSVRAMLDQTRQKGDLVTASARVAAKMTAAERKTHLANLMALVEIDEKNDE